MEPFRLIVVNNGETNVWPYLPPNDPRIIVLNSDKNLGWMGGINGGVKWALENKPAKYFCFINDDVQIVDHDYGWITKMLLAFQKPGIGAVGPVSNMVMGYQHNKYIGYPPYMESARLSGLCLLTTREIIEKVGLLDESLPGGDDLDMSIRIRDAGYKLCICRRTFILHHYAQTGKRVHGDYWDSRKHSEDIAGALIHKHGFKKYFACINDMLPAPDESHNYIGTECNYALDELSQPLKDGLVLDLGCGGKKIHPNAVGVDIRPKGTMGVGYNALVASGGEMEADVCDLHELKDGSVDGILSKHLLEHILRPIPALREWNRVLKDGGKLVIIVPDWRFCEAISCDPSHIAAYTPESLKDIIEAAGGFKVNGVKLVSPGYVFGISCEKIPSRVAVAA